MGETVLWWTSPFMHITSQGLTISLLGKLTDNISLISLMRYWGSGMLCDLFLVPLLGRWLSHNQLPHLLTTCDLCSTFLKYSVYRHTHTHDSYCINSHSVRCIELYRIFLSSLGRKDHTAYPYMLLCAPLLGHLWLCDPMDHGLPASSVQRIL